MTNQEIVEQVFNTYKVRSMIKKLIKNSTLDDSFKDLEQIIYCQLLIMDNEKLNHLFNSDGLRRWINQIIKNQRNYYLNDYQRSRIKPQIVETIRAAEFQFFQRLFLFVLPK